MYIEEIFRQMIKTLDWFLAAHAYLYDYKIKNSIFQENHCLWLFLTPVTHLQAVTATQLCLGVPWLGTYLAHLLHENFMKTVLLALEWNQSNMISSLEF